MSCDMAKLEFLKETKQLFRETIDPSGRRIKDETPFRDYISYMSTPVTSDAAIMLTTVPIIFGNFEKEEETNGN